MTRVIHIIVNPAAGSEKAAEFIKDHVEPLLKHCDIPYEIHTTRAAKDAGKIGQRIQSANSGDQPRLVVVAGGDGTAHELIEGVLEQEGPTSGDIGQWQLVVLPCGTANALFYSLFPKPKEVSETGRLGDYLSKLSQDEIHPVSSLIAVVRSFTSSAKSPKPLPITLTSIDSAPPIPSHIVLSTSLHASILHDSEALRATMPGIERFKVAAAQNLPVAYRANAVMKGRVRQYSPKHKAFVEPFTAAGGASEWKLDGPFSYFLSSTTADRLEQAFVPISTLSVVPPDLAEGQTMDIVVIRPSRDPLVRAAGSEDAMAEARAKRVGEIAGAMYSNGKHISLTYKPDGSGETEEAGEGEVVVEVFRAERFDWMPTDPEHAASHYVCADGDIHNIAPNGKASVHVMSARGGNQGFYVWG